MITLSNIYLQYGDRIIFDHVDLAVGERERIGLVGKNGAGKSTLLRIIAGEANPDSGKVSVPNEATIGFLHQDMDIAKDKTVIAEAMTAFEEAKKIEKRIAGINEEITERTDYESEAYHNLLEELAEKVERFALIGGEGMRAGAERVLDGLGFKPSDMDRPVGEFSGGWQMRVELAKLLLRKPDYLLLDEPTNHLDIESILWLEEFLQNYEGSIILISHDKMFLNNITRRTVEVEFGKLYDYKAGYSKFKGLQAERREKLIATWKNQQKEIERKQQLIDKFRAKANKAKMAQSLIKELERMDVVELEEKDSSTMRLSFPQAPRAGEIVADVKDMSKSYGDVRVLRNVDFRLHRGERVAFVGQNGQGKTTLSRIILGNTDQTSGKVELGHNVQIGYYAQDQSERLDPKLTVLQTLERESPPEMRTRLRAILGAFLFSGEEVEKKVSVLSGGERARVALAILMLRPVNLLVLDEPTNHLDIQSKEVLKEAILDYDGALIAVSHDREFLTGLTDRTVEFRDHKLHNYLGDVQYFLEKRKARDMREIERSGQSPVAGVQNSADNNPSGLESELSYEERKELKRQQDKHKRELKRIEREIEKAEAEMQKIELQMADPDFYGSEKAEEVIAQYKKLKSGVEELYKEWETISS